MEVIKTMPAGTPGTLRYLNAWQDQLIAVRYRKDTDNQRLITTIEIVVDHRPLTPSVKHQAKLAAKNRAEVAVKIEYSEMELREKLKKHGARWDKRKRLWVLPYGDAKALGISSRIVHNA